MDVTAYLERIGYRGPVNASVESLHGLHLAHLQAVPFENLDIIWGRPIGLGGTELFDKIVTRRRGGFCYELNGLFGALLRRLGFRVTMLSAEVARAADGFSPEFDHLALLVALDEPWLVDVGFGDGFRLPLHLSEDVQMDQDGRTYRFATDGEYRILLRRDPDDWRPQFRFTPQPHALEDFAVRCRFHQSSPESHFTRGRLCTLATPEGRITLSDLRLIVTTGAQRVERQLTGESEFATVLRQTFGVIE